MVKDKEMVFWLQIMRESIASLIVIKFNFDR
jgi:hypothetical protein